MLVVPSPDPDPWPPVQELPRDGREKTLWVQLRDETGHSKDRFMARVLFANMHYNTAILEFLSTTDMGKSWPLSPLGVNGHRENAKKDQR